MWAARYLLGIAEPMDAVRTVILAYFNACDVPRFDFDGDYGRLFTEDAIWEGVGEKYAAKFGRLDGRLEIVAALQTVMDIDRSFVFNHHLLSNEMISVVAINHASGSWSMMQMSTLGTGESIRALSRIEADFRIEEGVWRIAHFRTRNLFYKIVPDGWNHAQTAP